MKLDISDEEFFALTADLGSIGKREFTPQMRDRLAAKNIAMADGSFPIENTGDLKNAISDWGRARNKAAARAHIIQRALDLRAMDQLPQGWNINKSYDEIEFELRGEISKKDEDQQLVFGWASVGIRKNGEVVIDRQGDILDDPAEIEKSAYDFVLHSRDGGEMHVRKGVSTLVESFVSTPEKLSAMGLAPDALPMGWWTGWKVRDKNVWSGVKSGKYPMFSVHGRGIRTPVMEV